MIITHQIQGTDIRGTFEFCFTTLRSMRNPGRLAVTRCSHNLTLRALVSDGVRGFEQDAAKHHDRMDAKAIHDKAMAALAAEDAAYVSNTKIRRTRKARN